MVPRIQLSVSLAIPALLLAACGGGGENYRIPADHPIKPFEEPEREELVQEEEDAWDIDFDEEEEGAGEAEEAEETEDSATPEPEEAAAKEAAAAPEIRIGETSAKGSLDKNIIRRYIRRKLPRFKNCYERELLKDKNLAGTVQTEFIIGADGKVEKVEASGMGNRKVEECVAGVVRSIVFPKPKGGGKVTVKYPFNFKSAS